MSNFLNIKPGLKIKPDLNIKIWDIAHMGHGPYGPGPIWAPGPWAPGPSLLGKHLTKKRTLEKRVQIVFFVCFFVNKKDARRPYDHFGGGIAPRSLLCVRKRRFPFLKKGRNLVRNLPRTIMCPGLLCVQDYFVNSPPAAGCERTPFAINRTLTNVIPWIRAMDF